MELQEKKNPLECELTTEKWSLYNFIKARTLNGEKTTVKDVCEKFPDIYHLNDKESNFSNCPNLYKDIDFLNEHWQIEKIIVKDNNNFHLATEEEAKTYAKKIKVRGLKLLKKYWVVYRKIEKDGQGKCTTAKGDPIDEKSKARRFYESFIDELIEEDQ